MASVIDDPNGRRRIQFVDANGKRPSIRLGKIDRKSAETIERHVENLLTAKNNGQPLRKDTAAWLEEIGVELKDKLAAVGLIAAPSRLTVEGFLTEWLAARKEYKPSTRRAWEQVTHALTVAFGAKLLATIDHRDAEAFRQGMIDDKYSATTVHKRLGHARQMFADARRAKLIAENPFEFVRHRGGCVSDRRAYISVVDIQKVLEQAPSTYWRLLIVFARFAGLRVPSEPLSLRWSDVDWAELRLTVPTPKLEHLPGRSFRVMPLFPIVREALEEAFALAPDGSIYIFPDEWRERGQGENGWGGANFRTNFKKMVKRAGLTPWPRIWHSLRASCESDLAAEFPLPAVTKWLGNTPSVAMRHYVDATDELFTKATTWQPSGAKSGALEAHKPAQQQPAMIGGEPQSSAQDVIQPSDMHDSANRNEMLPIDLREWMGIEPT